MTLKCMLLILIYGSAVCHFASSVTERTSQRDTNNNFMKVNQKIDLLSERLDNLKINASTENSKFDVDEIKGNIKQMMISIDEIGKKSENISKVVELLFELIGKIEQENSPNETKKIVNDMTSKCNTMCDSNVNNWARETNHHIEKNLKKVNHCIHNLTFQSDLEAFNACDPNPCFNGGQCELTSTGRDYLCTKCPFITSGKRCENLNCNRANRCWQYQDTLYVVFEESITWDQAYDKCVREGMNLAIPKDKDITESIIRHLKTIYQPTQYLHFFIGLKVNGSEWRWIDGTPLGDYVGGKADFKSLLGLRWGIMLTHVDNIYWWTIAADEIHKHIHYPLCEKRISIRF